MLQSEKKFKKIFNIAFKFNILITSIILNVQSASSPTDRSFIHLYI